jgi:TonB family protein
MNRPTPLLLTLVLCAAACGSSTPEAEAPPGGSAAPVDTAGPTPAGAPSSTPNDAASQPTSAPAGATAPAEPETKELTGRIDQNQVRDILLKNGELFNDCYTIGAGKGEQFVGTVTVRATVGPKGNVTEAKVVKSTAKNPKVDACVIEAFKKIKFPPPKDSAASIVTFPMEFKGALEEKKK